MRDRPLAREIAVVLVLKLAAIAVIWGAFFNPETKPTIDKPALDSRLLTKPAPPKPDRTR